MKVKVGGPLAHKWSTGKIESWTGATIEVDDSDEERVEFFRHLATVGHAQILQDAPRPEPEAPADPPEMVDKTDKAPASAKKATAAKVASDE